MVTIGCYKPLIRAEELGKWAKAQDGHLYHPAKIFSSRNLEAYNKRYSAYDHYEIIPCGKCIGCRLDYSREWANRGYLESLQYPNVNWFVTLTYDDDHRTVYDEMTTSKGITYTSIEELPWEGTLIPDDATKFIKKLRKYMQKKHEHTGIRVMTAGEYGSKNGREHLHFILFNCPFPAESFYKPKVNWEKNVYWQNKIIEKCWSKGISNITEANWQNISYVARYITKKQFGPKSEDYYCAQGKEKEFFRVSNRPGIGYQYYEDNKDKIYSQDAILIKHGKASIWSKPPKYFDKMYEKENPEHFKEIKAKRQKEMINNLKIKGELTSLTRWEQYQVEQATKEEATKILKREL